MVIFAGAFRRYPPDHVHDGAIHRSSLCLVLVLAGAGPRRRFPGHVDAALLHTVKKIGIVAANLLLTKTPPFPHLGEGSLSLRCMSKDNIVFAVVLLRVSVVVPESSMFPPPCSKLFDQSPTSWTGRVF